MEDDVDWDIRLLSQLPELSKGVRTLSNIPLSRAQESPYGDDWDVLWPGHCGECQPEGDPRRYIMHDDPTVAPKSRQINIDMLKEHPEGARIVHKACAPICSFGYAVSYRGAQKVLLALGVKAGMTLAHDNGLGFLCKDGFYDIKCFSVEPMLFFHQ